MCWNCELWLMRARNISSLFDRLFEKHGLPSDTPATMACLLPAAAGVLGLSKLSAWWVALGIDLERSRRDVRRTMVVMNDTPGYRRELRGEEQKAALMNGASTFNEQRPHEAWG